VDNITESNDVTFLINEQAELVAQVSEMHTKLDCAQKTLGDNLNTELNTEHLVRYKTLKQEGHCLEHQKDTVQKRLCSVAIQADRIEGQKLAAEIQAKTEGLLQAKQNIHDNPSVNALSEYHQKQDELNTLREKESFFHQVLMYTHRKAMCHKFTPEQAQACNGLYYTIFGVGIGCILLIALGAEAQKSSPELRNLDLKAYSSLRRLECLRKGAATT